MMTTAQFANTFTTANTTSDSNSIAVRDDGSLPVGIPVIIVTVIVLLLLVAVVAVGLGVYMCRKAQTQKTVEEAANSEYVPSAPLDSAAVMDENSDFANVPDSPLKPKLVHPEVPIHGHLPAPVDRDAMAVSPSSRASMAAKCSTMLSLYNLTLPASAALHAPESIVSRTFATSNFFVLYGCSRAPCDLGEFLHTLKLVENKYYISVYGCAG